MSKIIKITPKMEKEKHFIWDKKLQCVKCVSCGYSKYQCKCSLLEALKMDGVLIKDIRELIVEFVPTLPDPSQSCFYCKEKNVSQKLERGEEYICDECYEEQDYDGSGRVGRKWEPCSTHGCGVSPPRTSEYHSD